MKKLNETRKLVLYNWKALLGFEIIYKFASVVIFVPLLWGMFDLIMRVSGYAYLTLENIVSFLANPLTVFLLLALLILVTMYAMIDISAVIFILDQARQKNKVYFLQILKFSVGNAARAWKPKNLMLVVTVLLLMPFLNMGMASGVLSSISIPEFILDYIRADSFLSGLFNTVVLLLSALMMRWLYAFHYFTLEGCSFREARRKSSRLSRKKKLRDFGVMLLLQLVYGLCYMLYLLLLVTLAVAAGNVFADMFVFRWVTSTLIWAVFLFSVMTAAVLGMPISYGCVSILYYRHKEETGEDVIHSQAPAYTVDERRRKTLHRRSVALACVVAAGCFGIGYLLCSGKVNPQIEYIRTMEITAHRGASAFYPENTMAAFIGAKKMGADWIELDVQQTKDGQIIVIHDTNLQRTAGLNANTWDMTYEEISVLDAGGFFDPAFAGEKVPLFSEAAVFAKENGMKLNIELKPTGHERDFEKNVVDIVRQAGIADSCVITSQVYEVLEHVKAYDPSITTVYVMSLAYGDINRLEAADCSSVEAASATAGLISRVHNAGKELFVWTVNTEDSINRMIDLNVDNIITDDIELAKQCVYESRYGNLLEEYLKLFQ